MFTWVLTSSSACRRPPSRVTTSASTDVTIPCGAPKHHIYIRTHLTLCMQASPLASDSISIHSRHHLLPPSSPVPHLQPTKRQRVAPPPAKPHHPAQPALTSSSACSRPPSRVTASASTAVTISSPPPRPYRPSNPPNASALLLLPPRPTIPPSPTCPSRIALCVCTRRPEASV
ncbi:unnamed protein product [Closterium sp. NIES-53]